jgi:tricorn protease
MPRFAAAARAALVFAAAATVPSLASPAAGGVPEVAPEALLLRDPALGIDSIVFAYAGDLWRVGLDGGEAVRLTVHPGVESAPVASPDGRRIAFTASYEGNADVYVVSIEGGDPRRLTFHPQPDQALDFTPDGRRVLFSSPRASDSPAYTRFFAVPVEGGVEELVPPPMASRGCFAPDAKKLAYTAIPDAFETWKRYRGGTTPAIWLFDFASRDIEEVPHGRWSDTAPRWAGETVLFLSDREGTMNLFEFDVRSREVRQVTRHEDFDVKSFSVRGDLVVYEQGFRLLRLDRRSGRESPLTIRLAADLPETRRHFEPALRFARDAGLSPAGVRAVFEARGDLFTVPAKKGDVRNVTRTPGVHERSPAWSPDGKQIACFSDESGEYELLLYPQDGLSPPEKIRLGSPPTFYYAPSWSPDGKHLACTDKRLNLWIVEAAGGVPVLVDTDLYDHPVRSLDPCWSPDGKWLAYTRRMPNHYRAVFVFDLERRRSTQVTDGRSDAASACFTRDGKHLCFLASTNVGLNVGWLDMSSYERPVRSAVYAIVLDKDAPSPIAPESDEEKPAAPKPQPGAEPAKDEAAAEAAKAEAAAAPAKAETEPALPAVKIDFEGLDQRIVSLPIPARNWARLQAGADGKLFLVEQPELAAGDPAPPQRTLHRFDFKERKLEPFLSGLAPGFRTSGDGAYWLSGDGKKLLYSTDGPVWGIVDATGAAPKGGDGALQLTAMQADVDPRVEWAQMFEEACRIERDFFYVANLHGVDWPAACAKYRPFVAHVGHRADLAYLLSELVGELVIGHAYVFGGDFPETQGASAGLLGCDFSVEEGRYRIARIFSGENWNPDLRAPLTQPGVRAAAGDWLLAIDGREIAPPQNVHAALLGTAGKQVVLKLGKSPQDPYAWTTTVVPVASEAALRQRAWIEGNRRKVDQLSDGRVAYVYMPNTAEAGYLGFNRDYFAALDREAVVLDERFNGGGSAADYVIDMLRRPLLSMWATREGREFSTPAASIFGPKVMIINELAGSGGDAMPLYFRRAGLGKLVGRRTWGGLVGIYDYPVLMDGGIVTAPRMGIYSPDGRWEVENEGVAPDVDVLLTPRIVLEGHDPQLETAVEIVLKELAERPVKPPSRPPDPDRVHGG